MAGRLATALVVALAALGCTAPRSLPPPAPAPDAAPAQPPADAQDAPALPETGTPEAPPPAPPAPPPADAAADRALACTPGQGRCTAAGQLETCALDGSGWGGASACAAPDNGTAACVTGACAVRCNPGFGACKTPPVACTGASWDFSAGLGGFVTGGSALTGTSISSARGGPALALAASFSYEAREIVAEVALCPGRGGMDLAGRRTALRAYLEGPAALANATAVLATVIANRNHVERSTQLTPNQWTDIDLGDVGARPIEAMRVQLHLEPASFTGWTGTLYLDDLRIE